MIKSRVINSPDKRERDVSQEDQGLLENPSESLTNPSHTAQYRHGWLHLLSQFPRGGKSGIISSEGQQDRTTLVVEFGLSIFSNASLGKDVYKK